MCEKVRKSVKKCEEVPKRFWEKTPTPKTRVSIWSLLRTLGRFTTRPFPAYFSTKMSVVRPFSVLSKDEIGPESKTGRFLSRLKSWGWGSFPPLQGRAHTRDQNNKNSDPPHSHQGAAEGGRQKGFDHLFFLTFIHFLITFSDASAAFLVAFLPGSVCRTPPAARCDHTLPTSTKDSDFVCVVL